MKQIIALLTVGYLLSVGCSGDKSPIGPELPELAVGFQANQPLPGNTNGDNTGLKLRQAARLDGMYGGEIRIEGNSWQAVSSHQEISLLFNGSDLKNIRQIEFILEFHPLSAFDRSSSVFVPQDPFLTFGAGVEPLENGQLRIGAASVSSVVEGDQMLGTFTIRTSDTFNTLTSTYIEVVFLSLGPSSSDRENYQREDLTLGVVLND